MVIFGGGFRDFSMNLAKRNFNKLIDATPVQIVTLDRFRGKSEPITFYLEEFLGGAPNSNIPLLVRAKIDNFDVHLILVDKGSYVDVMYTQIFRTL